MKKPMFLEKKAQQENIGFFQVVEKYIGVFIHKTQSERRSLQASEKAHLTFRPAILILFQWTRPAESLVMSVPALSLARFCC